MQEELESAKSGNLGQILLRAARLYNERAVSEVQNIESEFSIAHTTLIPHIELSGTRSSDIAKKLGISKQAVGQLVSELEKKGFLERVPDPSDGRAKLVTFTPKGKESLLQGLGVLKRVELELTSALSSEAVEILKSHLELVIAHFEARA